MKNLMQIEIISPAPVEAVALVMRQVHGDDFETRLLGRALADVLGDPSFHAVVAVVDGAPISSIILHSVPHLLVGLCTIEPFRRQGFASQLIDRAIDEASALDASSLIFAAIEIDSIWEQEKYQARGFRLIHDNALEGYLILARESGNTAIKHASAQAR